MTEVADSYSSLSERILSGENRSLQLLAADGVLPLLFPPEHYFGVKPLLEAGQAERTIGTNLDFAACVWVSLAEDEAAARRVLTEKIAYYGAFRSKAPEVELFVIYAIMALVLSVRPQGLFAPVLARKI